MNTARTALMGLSLGLWASCGRVATTPDPRGTYRAALELAEDDPVAAWDRCTTIRDPELEGDCRLVVVEALAADAAETTEELLTRCAGLAPVWIRDECAFQVGERRRAPEACAKAGGFADDCRLHLLSSGLASWVPKDASPSDAALLARLAEEARAMGLAQDDPRAWSSWFRWVLGQQATLDRSVCHALEPAVAEACWRTGQALYDDRLNQARDQGLYPCDGGATPALLAHAPDEELDALRMARERIDLCPGARQ